MQNRRSESKTVTREVILAELKQGWAAVDSYAEQHGSFSELVREHYERVDRAADGNSSDPGTR